MLRAGEFTCVAAETTDPPLSPSDVSVDSRDSPQLVVVHLRRTKTCRPGCHIYLILLHALSLPCSNTPPPPPPPTSGPLFLLENGAPLTRTALVTHLRIALAQAGVDASRYAGHSFRIGAATAAAQAGYSDSFIQSLGRWKSAAFITYIRISVDKLASVASRLVRGDH